jgi:hypothetical protein
VSDRSPDPGEASVAGSPHRGRRRSVRTGGCRVWSLAMHGRMADRDQDRCSRWWPHRIDVQSDVAWSDGAWTDGVWSDGVWTYEEDADQ